MLPSDREADVITTLVQIFCNNGLSDFIQRELHSAAACSRGVGGALPPNHSLEVTFLPLSPSQPPSAAPVCRSDPGPTAESEREDACARARGSRCAVGAPGRPRARQRVGAADGDTRAPKVRVCAAEAKGSDRHCGSQRRAQPATLPGLHGEAGVPEGAHSDLVRDAETPPTKHNRRNPVHASCACIFLNFSFASFPSSRRAFPAHGTGDCAACLLIILINSNNAPALTDLLLWAFFPFFLTMCLLRASAGS